MKDKELLRTVRGFTKGLLGGKPSFNMCYAVCTALQGYLSFCKYKTTLTEGEIMIDNEIHQHFWLTREDGLIIDPTADQFNLKLRMQMPAIYIGIKPDHYLELENQTLIP